MFDPLSVAFEIRYPWKKTTQFGNYADPLITIWHRDPCTHGNDDSCWREDGGMKMTSHGIRLMPYKQPTGFRLNPKFHIWHWRLQFHPWQKLMRWLFSRCAKCGKGFTWNYYPSSTSWNSKGPGLFRRERNIQHHNCGDPSGYNAQAAGG